jgi:molybdopterin-biosynthesis enzyme MoeA-like protein
MNGIGATSDDKTMEVVKRRDSDVGVKEIE